MVQGRIDTTGEKKLSIRSLDLRHALAAYERHPHKCAICGETFEFEQMHADHIVPWHRGEKTTPDNCQMICVKCNLAKGGANNLPIRSIGSIPLAVESVVEYEA